MFYDMRQFIVSFIILIIQANAFEWSERKEKKCESK